MSFWESCEHDWQPSAKTFAPPFTGDLNGHGPEIARTMKMAMMGYTTLIYQCSKCKDLHREECFGQGDFIKTGATRGVGGKP